MRLFKLHYPKLLLFFLAIILAYFIFKNPSVSNFISGLDNLGYLGIFIAGILLAFGFTAPFAVGFFIILSPENIWLAAFIGSLGAVIGDLAIFNFIRFSFMEEFKRLKNTKLFREADLLLEKEIGHRFKVYLMYLFAEILIASPLPDEVGILMLAGLKKIRQSILGIMSFVVHVIVILIVLKI